MRKKREILNRFCSGTRKSNAETEGCCRCCRDLNIIESLGGNFRTNTNGKKSESRIESNSSGSSKRKRIAILADEIPRPGTAVKGA